METSVLEPRPAGDALEKLGLKGMPHWHTSAESSLLSVHR